LDEAGEVLLEQKLPTTPEAMKQTFEKIPRSLIALETGTHSPRLSRLLKELGHAVLVAHAQKVGLISKSNRKDDRHDARALARLARIDPELLSPVRHRSAKAQIHLTVIRARAELVSARTALVNAARGLAKSYGERLPKCGTEQVSRELAAELSAEFREVLEPLLKEIESLNERIKEYDAQIEKIRQGELPASRAAQTGEGGRNADRADVCSDSRRPASVRKESRGRLFSRVKPAAAAHQQSRRPLFENDAGAGGALHPGAFWGR
jgi:transposase